MLSAIDVSAADPSPDVPLSHRIYHTIDRFEAHGWFRAPSAGMRPYSRTRVASLIVDILVQVDSGASVSRSERVLIERYKYEFRDEIHRLGYISGATVQRGWRRLGEPLMMWQDSTSMVRVEPLFKQQFILIRGKTHSRESVLQTYVGGILEGVYRDRFGFRIRHFEAREWSTRPRVVRDDVIARPIEFVQFKGKTVDFREASFQLVWGTKWFSLDFGKSTLDWGPGRSGNLFLGTNPPPFGMIRLKVSHGRVRFSHLVGFLHARPGTIDSSLSRIENGHLRIFSPSKYLSAHRLEIDLTPKISLGLHEAVIYGHRRPDFLYLPPVSVLAAAQMATGDKDNLLMGLDISLRPVNGVKTYLSFFMDDLRKFSPGAFSNKFGLQVGVFWVDPLHLRDTDLAVEYVRLSPYVYSHKFDINTFEHYDALLGYPLGPNADRLWGQLAHHFRSWLSFRLRFERDREGQNVLNPDGTLTNVGGDAEQGRRPQDPATKSFLAGHRETTTRFAAGVRAEPFQDMVFTVEYVLDSVGTVPLPTGPRSNARGNRLNVAAEYNFF